MNTFQEEYMSLQREYLALQQALAQVLHQTGPLTIPKADLEAGLPEGTQLSFEQDVDHNWVFAVVLPE